MGNAIEMRKDTIFLASKPIEIAEFANYKEATFLISVLDEYNLNNVLIAKDEGEKYHKTIIGYPIVAFLKYDSKGNPTDYGGHELRKTFNPQTGQYDYYFATFPVGSVTDAWIEDREVDGYEGEKSCILIKTKLWKTRYPNYFTVFDKLWDEGNLSSSWEISVNESEKTDEGKKLIDFEFIGNCMLGSKVKGAVNGAGVLEVASIEEETNCELTEALLKDIQISQELEKENTTSSIEEESINNQEDNQGGKDMAENKIASLTDNDIYTKVRKAINATDDSKWYYISRIYPYEFRAVAYEWDKESDDDYVEFTYSVSDNETVSITGQKNVKMVFIPKETNDQTIAEKDNAIAELTKKLENTEKELSEKVDSITKLGDELAEKDTVISEKENTIAELTPFKEKIEAIEKAEREVEEAQKRVELKAMATKNGYIKEEEFETCEELKQALENLDEKTIRVIKAERIVASVEEKEAQEGSVETSSLEKEVKTNLNAEKATDRDSKSVMKAFLS